jgi:Raf kinase inhibitor-like YbhB/YbcL family protein
MQQEVSGTCATQVFSSGATRAPARHGAAWIAFAAATLLVSATATAQQRGFAVTSATFTQGSTLPLSMVDQFPATGPNECTADGSAGGNMSPDLSWTAAPSGAVSFAVVAFDVTASFTHWGIYNIPASTRHLPANAGVAGSTYGLQVHNDFPSLGYEGPCPPPGVAPFAHQYVFTVYALDETLALAAHVNFPANAQTLEQALLLAAIQGHVLGKGSISGFFSSTPPTP